MNRRMSGNHTLLKYFKRTIMGPNDIISAGSVNSACTAGGRGQLYMWGKVKKKGDEWMYPKPVIDLSGWNIRCMASGSMQHAVGADDSCISWGHSEYGELGYGPTQKSSVKPKKVDILEGMHVTSVGCGVGMSLIVVDRANVGGKLDQLDTFDGDADAIFQENTKELYFPALRKHPAVDETEETPPEAKQATNSRSNKLLESLGTSGARRRGQDRRSVRGGGRVWQPWPRAVYEKGQRQGSQDGDSGANAVRQGRGRPKKGSPGGAPAEAGGKKSGKRGRPRK